METEGQKKEKGKKSNPESTGSGKQAARMGVVIMILFKVRRRNVGQH